MNEDVAAQQRNIVQENIRDLLDSNLPTQISQLEESTSRLEHLAAFCEANYLQSQNKADALLVTKRCALQSLAGVAYFVGELSRSLLNALDLEQMNLAQKTAEIENIGQLIAIQKEKAARREIGKLTTAKNVIRQAKITYPATEEPTPRYQRSAIDFTILADVGHGWRAPALQQLHNNNNNDYGSIGHELDARGTPLLGTGVYTAFAGRAPPHLLVNDRTGLTASAESVDGSMGSGSAGGGGGALGQQQVPAVYDYYARTGGNYGTLTRGSIRSAMRSSAGILPQRLQQPNLNAHHLHHHPSMMQRQQIYGQQMRYASTVRLDEQPQQIGGALQDNSINNYGNNAASGVVAVNVGNGANNIYEQYGTLQLQQQAASNATHQLHSQQQQLHPHPNGQPIDDDNAHLNNSADYSDDGLPLPPPLLLNAANEQQQNQRFSADQDDNFPLPPSSLARGTSVGSQAPVPNWVPQQHIEKAYVLYDYESRNTDELRLYQGAIVYVLKKNEDGWFEGVMDGITGLFPGNYVQPLPN